MIYNKIAIIGANGFIGRNLVTELLLQKNIELKLFGRSEKTVFNNSIPYYNIDLTNESQVNEHFKEIDTIYYLASSTIPASSWENPISDICSNLLPFVTFLELVCKMYLKKIIFISSAGTVYGPSNLKLTESSDKKPFSPHGIIKLTMEYFLNYFHHKYGITYHIYRVANVYGEGQDTGKGLGIINTFLENIISKSKIKIFGDGSNVRNYLYVKDLAKILALSIPKENNTCEIYNLSSNDTISINELVNIIKEIVEQPFEIEYTPTRKSDNSIIFIDNSKLLMHFPTIKFTQLSEGIKHTYQYLNSKF